MARRERADRVLLQRISAIEKRMFVIKQSYEKYFAGTEPLEPIKDRESLKREMREISRISMTTTRERYKWQTLKARMSALESYWQRNLLMIERGTHPKMQFRAEARARSRGNSMGSGAEERLEAQRQIRARAAEEEANLRQTFNDFISARKKCGQDTGVSFRAVREVLRGQAEKIQTQYKCKEVEFTVSVEKGKAKVKAVPVR